MIPRKKLEVNEEKKEETINIEAQLHSYRTRFLGSGVAHLFEMGTHGVFSSSAGF